MIIYSNENAETLRVLKEQITQQQNELYKRINEYEEKYQSFLYDVLHKCKMSGDVMRKCDKITGKFRVEKNDKYAFLEPYIIRFVPNVPRMKSTAIYAVELILKEYERIII